MRLSSSSPNLRICSADKSQSSHPFMEPPNMAVYLFRRGFEFFIVLYFNSDEHFDRRVEDTLGSFL